LEPESGHSSSDDAQFLASQQPSYLPGPRQTPIPVNTSNPAFYGPTYLISQFGSGVTANPSVPGPAVTQPHPYSSSFINLSRPQAVLGSSPSPLLNLGAFPYPRYPPAMTDTTNELDGPPTAQMQPIGPKGASEEPESPVDIDNSGFSPRRGFTHKRAEDPPRNGEGKMVCKFTNTCGGLIFERRCEWRYVLAFSLLPSPKLTNAQQTHGQA